MWTVRIKTLPKKGGPFASPLGNVKSARPEGDPEEVDLLSRLRHAEVVIRNFQKTFSGARVCHGGRYNPHFFGAFDVAIGCVQIVLHFAPPRAAWAYSAYAPGATRPERSSGGSVCATNWGEPVSEPLN